MIDKNKRRILAVILCLAIFVAGCQVGGPKVSKIAGLKGCWNFDEGKGNIAKNIVGTNHGEIKGGLKWVDGKCGKALQFNGEGYVSVKHEDYFNSPTFTVYAWTKLKDVSDYHYIVWKNGPEFPDIGPGRRVDIWVEIDGAVNIMWHNEDGLEERLYGQAKITDDKWHYVVEVYDGEKIKLYIDGSLDVQEKPSSKLPAENNEALWIGARPGGVAATGIIDEVCFYDRALSEEEIKTLSKEKM